MSKRTARIARSSHEPAATELVHIGQAFLALGGTLDVLVDTVFNYPTFAECYKVAVLDAYNKLRAEAWPSRAPPRSSGRSRPPAGPT
jgi:hypothetical protein